jgi:hypothetical protein
MRAEFFKQVIEIGGQWVRYIQEAEVGRGGLCAQVLQALIGNRLPVFTGCAGGFKR